MTAHSVHRSRLPSGFFKNVVTTWICLFVGALPVAGQESGSAGWDSAARFDELMQRMEKTESTLQELRDQNSELKEQLDRLPAAKDERGENPQKKEEKKWYDKLGIRGYAQFRYNYTTHVASGSASPDHAGDSSVSPNQEFLIRRARVILFGDVSDHLYVYIQPDFASTPNGAVDRIEFAQIRDWYGDVYIDKEKVNRLRIGQSKIPYGWENLQSSQNRLPLDRNDPFNSAAKNERDLGVFYYWTPEWAQETFKYIMDENLKGSGNYGLFALGVYNGQGGSLQEFNDQLHLISRFTMPLTLESGQIVEFGVQGYTGQYVVTGAAIAPLGIGPAVVPLGTRNRPGGQEGQLDQRLGASFVYYPQPIGVQAEYTIGRGPELNAAQTEVARSWLDGGYILLDYRHVTDCHGELWPFARWQYYRGGYKNAPNAPASRIDEWSIGLEWQIRKEMELVCEYLITDRTNLQPSASQLSYQQFVGQVARFQFQINY